MLYFNNELTTLAAWSPGGHSLVLYTIALLLSLGYVVVILSRLAQGCVALSFHLSCRLAQDMSRRHFTSYELAQDMSRRHFSTRIVSLGVYRLRPSSLHSRTSCSWLDLLCVCLPNICKINQIYNFVYFSCIFIVVAHFSIKYAITPDATLLIYFRINILYGRP